MEHWNQACFTLVLLQLLCPCQGLLPPRFSFSFGSLHRALTRFSSSDVGNTTTLLLSDDGNTLLVGAKDTLFALNVSQPGVMEIINKVDLAPSSNIVSDCLRKGNKQENCHNYIRVLQFLNDTHMYACGTYAFSPRCKYIDVKNFTLHPNLEDGAGRCPFNPLLRNTAVAVDGELYVGTTKNYRGTQSDISRFLSRERVDLKLDSNPGWLDDPTFIGSTFIASEDKVYYFFREADKSYEKYTVSRIAQVCTTDVGGIHTLQNSWTTFAKANLLCQVDSDQPFNVIQDIVTLPPPKGGSPDDTLFFGIFSSQWSMSLGKSAVCKFQLKDIKKVFSGRYKLLDRDTLQWDTISQNQPATAGKCGLHTATDNILNFVKNCFLAEESVRSVDRHLALTSPDQCYSRIAAQRIRAANNRDYTVLFLLTESGFLHKVVLLDKGPHIIEEVQVLMQPQSVKNLLLSVTKGVVFVGSSEGVFQVPVSNCSFYWNCAECVLAQDPSCAWDPDRAACADVSTVSVNALQDVESGKVTETCAHSQIGEIRSEEVYVSLNEVVTLKCPMVSSLATLEWNCPNGHHPTQEIYLQQEPRTLLFPAMSDTLGNYSCTSLEKGHKQTLAIFLVKEESKSASMTAMSNYHKLVAVSVFLAVTLCLLFALGFYVWHSRSNPHARDVELVDSEKHTDKPTASKGSL